MKDAAADRLRELFDAVVDRPAQERQACYDQQQVEAELRERVERLIRADRVDSAAEAADETVTLSPASAAEPLVPGFTLLRRLGQGGMGMVYEARDERLQHRVAIKLLHPQALDNPRARSRFRCEMEILASMQHDHIVRIHHGSSFGAQPYCVMELLTGGTLSDKLATEPMSAVAAAELLRRLAQAVHYAHQRTVLHRDLKPQNIIFDAAGTPKLTDFGIAKRLDEERPLTAGYEILGTPAYMAPEQTLGNDGVLTTATDVYGLGAILYHCLTGKPPYQGSVWEIIRQVQEGRPLALRQRQPQIPRAIESICLKCLATDPQDRYASANALAEDLECWLEGRPLKHQRTHVARSVWLWVVRQRVAATILLLLFLLIPALLTTGGLFLLWEQERTYKQELQQAYRQLDFRQYSSLLRLANDALAEDRHGDALRLLERCPPEFRGWEWSYLDQLCPLRRRVTGHSNSIAWIAASHDGRWLATASFDETYKLWEAASGREVFHSETHGEYVRRIAFRPDDQELAVGVDSGEIWLRAVDGGTVRRKLVGHTRPVNGLCYTPDGQRLASASVDGTIRLWNPLSGDCLRVLENDGIKFNGIRCTPDGQRLVTGDSAGKLSIWEIETGERLESLAAHEAALFGLQLAPAGDGLASGGADARARIWQGTPPHLVHTLEGHRLDVNDVAFHPRGDLLVTASDDLTVRLWDVTTGAERRRLEGHQAGVQSACFVENGHTLVTAGFDGRMCTWDLDRALREPLQIPTGGGAGVVGYSPDGVWLAVGGEDGGVRIVAAGSGELQQELTGHVGRVTRIAWGREGQVATLDAELTVRIWQLGTRTPRQEIRTVVHPEKSVQGMEPRRTKSPPQWNVAELRRELLKKGRGLGGLAFSPDGQTLALSVLDEVPQLRPLPARTPQEDSVITLVGHERPVIDLCYCPDGRRIATASLDKTVKLWDARSGALLATLAGHQDYVVRIRFSPDGTRLASLGEDFSVRLWDTRTGQPLHTLEGHTSDVMGVCFSPNGSRLASLDARHGLIIWDPDSGADLLTIKGPATAVTLDVDWSPDGQRIVVASDQAALTVLGGLAD
ncbi:MAG: protein kinase [Pirellulales bacterium]